MPSPFPPDLKEATQTSSLTETIRGEIVSGVFPPGTKLKVRELADRYQVGATPVREALSRLVPSTLVVAEDHRGFRVASLDRDELMRLTWTRVELESVALKASIETGGVEWESRVLAAHHRLVRQVRPSDLTSPDYRLWEEAHHEFHTTLLSGCKSPWLLDFIDTLFNQFTRYRRLSAPGLVKQVAPVKRDVEAEHNQLLQSALGGDVKRACEQLEAHYWATAKRVLGTGGGMPA